MFEVVLIKNAKRVVKVLDVTSHIEISEIQAVKSAMQLREAQLISWVGIVTNCILNWPLETGQLF